MSDINIKKEKARRIALLYLAFTVLSLLFAIVYEHFSHGVYSPYMIFMFAFPLLGGVVPFSIIAKKDGAGFPDALSYNLYNAGIETLTLGSCMKGVFDIYGSSSIYLPIYWIAGISLAVIGILIYLFKYNG